MIKETQPVQSMATQDPALPLIDNMNSQVSASGAAKEQNYPKNTQTTQPSLPVNTKDPCPVVDTHSNNISVLKFQFKASATDPDPQSPTSETASAIINFLITHNNNLELTIINKNNQPVSSKDKFHSQTDSNMKKHFKMVYQPNVTWQHEL